MKIVREHYERFPYPPIPTLALPARGEGDRLAYPGSHEGIRILVAGAGTFEPLVVAQSHRGAAEVVAVDLSESSIAKLRARIQLARLSPIRRKLPPVTPVVADLNTWNPDGLFDYVIASNVLHHTENPAATLSRLSSFLKPGGTMRVVTYPKQSRLWMRETSRWLKKQIPDAQQLSRRALVDACALAIERLPERDPVRSCFESQPETASAEGLADAFFNPCENPLRPLAWETASIDAGLELLAEGQSPTSHSTFLTELLPETAKLTRWERLQILDDALELCANPVFWFRKISEPNSSPVVAQSSPSHSNGLVAEMIEGLRSANALLKKVNCSVIDLLDALEREVGPRVTAGGEPLPGLSITEYPFLRIQFAESEDPGVVAQTGAAQLPESGAAQASALAGADDDDLRL